MHTQLLVCLDNGDELFGPLDLSAVEARIGRPEPFQLRGVPSRCHGSGTHLVHAGLLCGGIEMTGDPAVADAAGARLGGGRMAADQDGQALLRRLRLRIDLVETIEVAGEGHIVVLGFPQRAHQRDVFLGARAALVPGHLQGFGLFLQPAGADAEIHATARQGVDGGNLARVVQRIAQGQDADGRIQAHTLGDAGQEGHGGQALVQRREGLLEIVLGDADRLGAEVVHRFDVGLQREVVDHHDTIETQVFGGLRHVANGGGRGQRAGVRNVDGEFHGDPVVVD